MICPVCSSSKTFLRYIITKWKYPLYYRKCACCGSYYQYPAPKDPDSFYSSDYYGGKADYHYHDERKIYPYARIVHNARLKTLTKFVPNGTFLDVGCSFGGFVKTALSYYDAYGIDVSLYAVQEGQKDNVLQSRLFHGSLLKLPTFLAQKKFNVITLVEVAEHLENPKQSFQQAFSLLEKNGILLIQTANFDGHQAKREGKNYHYFLPGHLVCYTSRGLKQMLQDIGFQKFYEYIPTDFGVLPKLLKSRGNFNSFKGYTKWKNIMKYHFQSKRKLHGFPMTSSYVIYAQK